MEDISVTVESSENQIQHEIATLDSGAQYRLVRTTEGHENELYECFRRFWITVTGINNDIFEYPSGSGVASPMIL